MFRSKQRHRPLCSALTLLLLAAGARPLCGQGYDDAFELKSKLKVELQYADYGEYEYPEPVLFQYGVTPYRQDAPFIVNFPERRALVKYSRLVSEVTALSAKYQYADIKTDVRQHLVEGKLTHAFSETLTGIVSLQGVRDTRGFTTLGGGAGAGWDISPLTTVRVDLQLFHRGAEAVAVGGRAATTNARLSLRQVVTPSTAVQLEYWMYDADGDAATFHSHTGSFWISQWLPTQTALHVNLRLYSNTMGIGSVAPAVEVAQYVNWATVLWLKFRYYRNRSDNVSFGELGVVVPDGLVSRSFSIQLNREMSNALLLYAKYRYYTSNLRVRMNTYMLGAVYAF